MRWFHLTHFACLAVALVACSESPAAATRLPTARVGAPPVRAARVEAAAFQAPPRPATPLPVATPLPAPLSSTPVPPAAPVLQAPLDRYRAWMEQARVQYPYGEPLEAMWAVMLCESSGNADAVGGPYSGLFQYQASTWAGDWNPYRAASVFDPQAQIFATAKAWHEGNQHWWGCYGSGV